MASDRYLEVLGFEFWVQIGSPAAVREMGLGLGASKRLKV
jgi:hypothetical protein